MLLEAERKYYEMIEGIRRFQSLRIVEFMNKVNNGFKQSRTFKEARNNFQEIATVIYQNHKLLHIPIYFSVRKYKIRKAGEIFYSKLSLKPKSIVIFILRSIQYIDFKDPEITGEVIYFPDFNSAIDTLAHEIAHLKEIQKRKNVSHDHRFKKTFQEIRREILEL